MPFFVLQCFCSTAVLSLPSLKALLYSWSCPPSWLLTCVCSTSVQRPLSFFVNFCPMSSFRSHIWQTLANNYNQCKLHLRVQRTRCCLICDCPEDKRWWRETLEPVWALLLHSGNDLAGWRCNIDSADINVPASSGTSCECHWRPLYGRCSRCDVGEYITIPPHRTPLVICVVNELHLQGHQMGSIVGNLTGQTNFLTFWYIAVHDVWCDYWIGICNMIDQTASIIDLCHQPDVLSGLTIYDTGGGWKLWIFTSILLLLQRVRIARNAERCNS